MSGNSKKEGRPIILPRFGKELKEFRLKAGFSSQKEVVKKVKNMGAELSISSLSFYEQGRVQDIEEDILRKLSEVYDVPYIKLIRHLILDKYRIDIEEKSKLKLDDLEVSVGEPERSLKIGGVELVSLTKLKHEQEKLPNGSKVYVSAQEFLDGDHFLDMVINNLQRGISYKYLIPRGYEQMYLELEQLLLSGISNHDSSLNLREQVAAYLHSDSEFAFNFVIHDSTHQDEHKLSAFLGIVQWIRPILYYRVHISNARKLKTYFKQFEEREDKNRIYNIP